MVQMSARPPVKFSEKGDWNLWVTRFERYVQEVKVPDKVVVYQDHAHDGSSKGQPQGSHVADSHWMICVGVL